MRHKIAENQPIRVQIEHALIDFLSLIVDRLGVRILIVELLLLLSVHLRILNALAQEWRSVRLNLERNEVTAFDRFLVSEIECWVERFTAKHPIRVSRNVIHRSRS